MKHLFQAFIMLTVGLISILGTKGRETRPNDYIPGQYFNPNYLHLFKHTLFETDTIKKVDTTGIIGTCEIDLRPTPYATAYLKDLKYTKIEVKMFDGEFYGYPFTDGILNTDWDKIYFLYTTSDQSGIYYHSGYIEGVNVYGMTLNESRIMLMPWRGIKK